MTPSIYNLFVICGLGLFFPTVRIWTNSEETLGLAAVIPQVFLSYFGLLGVALIAGAIFGVVKPGPRTRLLAGLTFAYVSLVGATIIIWGEGTPILAPTFPGIILLSAIYSAAIVLIALNGRNQLDRPASSA